MKTLVTLLVALAWTTSASAHSGGQDANGCHNDNKAGNYHCHQGPLAGQTFSSKAEAMKALEKANAVDKAAPKPK
jgi:hypothetical protein